VTPIVAARLDGKVAVVTGSAIGLGAAIATAFANAGARVVVTGTPEALDPAAASTSSSTTRRSRTGRRSRRCLIAPSEVADVVLFLASDRATAFSGSVIDLEQFPIGTLGHPKQTEPLQ
jgi:NAD(P)-dependent dehydrogenase (short-subunit alcohol dehydrogenase family)